MYSMSNFITWSGTWWQDNSTLGMFCAMFPEGCVPSNFEQFCWFKILAWPWRWHGLSKEKLDRHTDLLKIFTSTHWSLQNGSTVLLPATLVMFYHKPVCHDIKAVLFHLHQRKVRLGFAVVPMNSVNVLSKHRQASHLHFSIWALLDHSSIEMCSTPCP